MYDRAVMRQTWIVMESLKNSFDEIAACVPSWIESYLTFDDGPDYDLDSMWQVIGVSESWRECLVGLQLRWQCGRLVVNRRFETDF